MKSTRLVVTVLVTLVLVAAVIGCSQPAPTPTAAPPKTTAAPAPTTTAAPAPTTTAAPKPTTTAPPAAIELKVSSFQPKTHLQSVVLEQWIAKMQQETNNAIKITSFYSGTLLKSSDDYDGVLKGVADMSLGAPNYYAGRLLKAVVFQQPTGAIANAVGSSRAAWQVYQQLWKDEMKDVKMVGMFAGPPNLLIFKNKQVTKLEDMKGMQIRVGGGTDPLIKALGAVPVFMAMDEGYLALQRGVVDGTLANYAHLQSYKFGEVAKYVLAKGMIVSHFHLIMNMAKWNSLPQNVKDVIDKSTPWLIDAMGAAWDKSDMDALEWSKKTYNTQVVTLSADENAKFDAAMASAAQEWVKTMEGKGYKDAADMLAKRDAIFKQYGSGK